MQDNDTEMYSTHNEGKSIVAERFLKFHKYVSSISKNVYTNKLDDIINEYSNIYHGTIKMRSVAVTSSTCIDFNVNSSDKDPGYEIGDLVRILQYKIIFAKGCPLNWCDEVFVSKKVKNTVPWTFAISDLNDVEIVRTFYEKGFQKTNQTEFRVIQRKGDKLYVKWKH